MATYMNQDIADRHPRVRNAPKLPIATEQERKKYMMIYTKKMMTDVYTRKEVWGLSNQQIAEQLSIDESKIDNINEAYKKVYYKGYAKEPTVFVPAWNDVIHIVDEKSLSVEEQKRRLQSRTERMKLSPSPEVAQNITTILTAVDDVQDFTTAVGVGSRLLERMTKAPHILSEGSFTTGALLNQLQLINKIPFEKLSIDEIYNMIHRKEIDLSKLRKSELVSIQKEIEKVNPTEYYTFRENMEEIVPGYSKKSKAEREHLDEIHFKEASKPRIKKEGWTELSTEAKQDFMREHYKMTRERWGMPLAEKKKMAESLYLKGSKWGKIQAEIDKRIARVLPTHGELIEMSQVSDQMAGIGISFGPIMGFITDTIFGAIQNRPMKYTKWTMAPEEKQAIIDAGKYLLNLPMETLNSLQYFGNLLPKAAYMIAAGENLGVMDFLKGTYTAAQAMVESRAKELHHAISETIQITKDWLFNTGPRTSTLVISTLAQKGIDHTREEGFPGVSIGREATIREIAEAYMKRCTEVIQHYEEKLTRSVYGEFLQSCIAMISSSTACIFCDPNGTIKETATPELAIYTRACDYGLEPPIWATNEQFANWHTFILDDMKKKQQSGPEYGILLEAKKRFFMKIE